MKNKENKEQIKAKMPNSAKMEYTEQEIQYYLQQADIPYIEDIQEKENEE